MCTYFYDWLEESFSYCSFRCWIIEHLFFVSRPFCVCFFTSSFTYFLLFPFHLNRLIQTRKTAITFCLVYNNNKEEGEEEICWKSLQQQYTHLVQRVEFGEIFYQSTNSSQCHYFVIVLFNFQDNAIWKRRIPWKIGGVLWRCLSFSVFWVIREDSLVVVFLIFLTKWWWCWFWCRFLASCLLLCLPFVLLFTWIYLLLNLFALRFIKF